MVGVDVTVHEDGCWLCQHVDASENPAPATRLSLENSVEENLGWPTPVPRRLLRCPDCNALWRVWVQAKVARPYVQLGANERSATPRYCHAPQRDIDRVIALVREKLPEVHVAQYMQTHPADDDGLWCFWVPDANGDIQLESPEGSCPFIVEHKDMRSSTEAWQAQTADAAAQAIVAYLADKSAEGATDTGPANP